MQAVRDNIMNTIFDAEEIILLNELNILVVELVKLFNSFWTYSSSL